MTNYSHYDSDQSLREENERLKIELIEEHLISVMRILGVEITESTYETPKRVAKMWVKELFSSVNNEYIQSDLIDRMTSFTNDYDSSVIICKDIPFSSTCEHHLLPFSGKVSIGYVPSDRVAGLSKFPRVVKYFSRKPQLQERLTTEIGDFLMEYLEPHALFILMEAEHQCVKCRGAESDCSTVTLYKRVSKGFESSYPDFMNGVK